MSTYAIDSWKEQLAIYQKLEDKAASVVAWFGGATGLFAVAAVAAVSKGELSDLASLASLLPFAAGLVAIGLALHAEHADRVPYRHA